jgi:hypothetical protein
VFLKERDALLASLHTTILEKEKAIDSQEYAQERYILSIKVCDYVGVSCTLVFICVCLYVQDHHSHFCWLRAIVHKDCAEIVKQLKAVFHEWSEPCILQTDNGGEFTGEEMKVRESSVFAAASPRTRVSFSIAGVC